MEDKDKIIDEFKKEVESLMEELGESNTRIKELQECIDQIEYLTRHV